MKRNSDVKFFKQDSHSLYITLVCCFTFFFVAISVLIFSFNGLISDHDQYLSGEMCTLLSEKVNYSIESMSDSVRNISNVLSAQRIEKPEEIYKTLKEYGTFDYVSIGFVDEEGRLYASDEEKAEFEKWNLYSMVKKTHPVFISMPYRSSLYGQHVITIFSDFEYGDSKHGYVFVTYLFEKLRNVAATNSLLNNIGIMLINAKSANIIECVGEEKQASGSWSNAFLSLKDIEENDRDKFVDFMNRMYNGEDDIGIDYFVNNVSYTQYSVAVDSMPGWYVSVRIPGYALSHTMHIFRNYVLVFTAFLLIVTLVLIANMYRLSKRQNRLLEQLSIYDPLTETFNRRAFDYASKSFCARGKKCVFIFFDIDYFKQVNDRFGHDVGDKLLKTFAGILKTCFAAEGIVSRFGGDEFVVLSEFTDKEEINKILSKVSEMFKKTEIKEIPAEERESILNFSAGAARYPYDSNELSGLKKCADTALYRVKENGRRGYVWYENG